MNAMFKPRAIVLLALTVIFAMVTMVFSSELATSTSPPEQRYARLIGGIQIQTYLSPRLGNCTISYSAEAPDGRVGVVTASHCVYNNITTRVYQPTLGSNNYIGVPAIARANIDTSFVPTSIRPCDPQVLFITYRGVPCKHNVTGYYSVDELKSLPYETVVCKTGRTTGTTCGAFYVADYSCVSLNGTIVCGFIILTSTMSAAGDSGSPLFKWYDCIDQYACFCRTRLLGHLMGGNNLDYWMSVATVVHTVHVAPRTTSG